MSKFSYSLLLVLADVAFLAVLALGSLGFLAIFLSV